MAEENNNYGYVRYREEELPGLTTDNIRVAITDMFYGRTRQVIAPLNHLPTLSNIILADREGWTWDLPHRHSYPYIVGVDPYRNELEDDDQIIK